MWWMDYDRHPDVPDLPEGKSMRISLIDQYGNIFAEEAAESVRLSAGDSFTFTTSLSFTI